MQHVRKSTVQVPTCYSHSTLLSKCTVCKLIKHLHANVNSLLSTMRTEFEYIQIPIAILRSVCVCKGGGGGISYFTCVKNQGFNITLDTEVDQ